MLRQRSSYFVTFTDDFSRYGYVYLLKHKHEVFETFKVFQKEVENQLGKTIKSLCSDRGGEYMSQEFLDHLKDYGIISHHNTPYTLQHNGVLERRNTTLLDMVRSMMSQTTLLNSFWDYALETAERILNMVPTKKGCEALIKRDTLTKSDKLEPRSIKYIFIGYPKETMGYSFNYPLKNKVLIAQNAKFLENSLVTQEAKIDEPQSDIVPIRSSTRTRHAPNHSEPANYEAALLDPKSEKWLNSINMEMQSMKDNEVWVLVELPPNGKTVGSKWLFKKKTDMNGVVHTYKARLMERGYTQNQGIDYEETFSPVADIRAIRILIAIAAYHEYKICVYIEKILKRYCKENSKCGSIPMQEKLKLSKSQGASTPVELERMQSVPYASTVGSIMYDVRCTRPNDADDLKSQTGYLFFLNGGAIDWKSAKQSIFAISSAEAEYIAAFDASKEAEYIAAFDASKEAVWVRKFISGLGVVPTIEEPISMYYDNTGAIAIANESGITKGARHFRAKFTTFVKLLNMVT
uniref:Retrovirus-related Pol polyprotein from transposon TNT 1-94 n=1 Tax=Tanacetum cinerariifolium TaxID=118510 RepID=A0A6L2KH36_TANCI|nr:retrovirus-related Pol polyprotein from transposon TNT 1-94 [Tanacetum cinerariifolium]